MPSRPIDKLPTGQQALSHNAARRVGEALLGEAAIQA